MAVNDIEIAQAIRNLSVLHPEGRSPALESRLLEKLTRTGKSRCETSAEAPLIKPEVPDMFSDTTGLPEIHATELNRDTLAAGILHHGALLVRQLYTAEQISRLEQLALVQEELDRQDHLPLGCSPHTLVELLAIYDNCGLLEAVRNYLGGDALIFAERTKLRQHRPNRDNYAAIPWHQDVNFFGMKSYAVNCWAAVTTCGEGNPGLGIIARRTEERLGWDGKDGLAPLDYGKSIPEKVLEHHSRDNRIAYPVLQPGDALLFDEMTVHQTALKRWSMDKQIVTISWFFRASAFPDWGTPIAI